MTRKLIILDIDETLIHASEIRLSYAPDFVTSLYAVYKRPHVHEFIDFCFARFRVAVWTTAGEAFANSVVEVLFNKEQNLEFVWSRQRCTQIFDAEYREYAYIKNLKKVKKWGFALDEVIMVDDTPFKLHKNYGNLVRVNEFTGDKGDNELHLLMAYLKDLELVESIRKVEKRGWQNYYKNLQ